MGKWICKTVDEDTDTAHVPEYIRNLYQLLLLLFLIMLFSATDQDITHIQLSSWHMMKSMKYATIHNKSSRKICGRSTTQVSLKCPF